MNLILLSNLLLLFTGFVGLLVTSILLRSYKSNKVANIYLLILLSFISIRYIFIGFFQFNFFPFPFKQPLIFKLFSLTIIPCFFLYFESLLAKTKKFNSKNLNHFILPFLIISSNLITNYIYSERPFWIFTVNFIYVSGTILFYILRMYFILRKKLWTLNSPNTVANYALLKNWTIFLYSICVLMGVRILISLINEFLYEENISASKFGFFFGPILWLILLFKLLISPEILHGIQHLKKRIEFNEVDIENLPKTWTLNKVVVKNEQDLKLKAKIEERLLQMTQDIDIFVKENRIFKTSRFSINDLALKLGIPKSHLVFLFKYHSNLTFSEYKSYQRINHAIDLIHNGHLSTNTLESLATEVGFSSYNPFFTAFKKHTGLSPNDYVLKKMK